MKHFKSMEEAKKAFDQLEKEEVVAIGAYLYKKYGDKTRGQFGNYAYFAQGFSWQGNASQYDEEYPVPEQGVIGFGNQVYMPAYAADKPEGLTWLVFDTDFGWL